MEYMFRFRLCNMGHYNYGIIIIRLRKTYVLLYMLNNSSCFNILEFVSKAITDALLQNIRNLTYVHTNYYLHGNTYNSTYFEQVSSEQTAGLLQLVAGMLTIHLSNAIYNIGTSSDDCWINLTSRITELSVKLPQF